MDENLKKKEENKEQSASEETISTPTVTEPDPLQNAEPDMVVLHTEEMDNPEVLVKTEESIEEKGEKTE